MARISYPDAVYNLLLDPLLRGVYRIHIEALSPPCHLHELWLATFLPVV
jgi:hypothetical protein